MACLGCWWEVCCLLCRAPPWCAALQALDKISNQVTTLHDALFNIVTPTRKVRYCAYIMLRGEPHWLPHRLAMVATQHIYLPTAFSLTVPFAMLPWGPAHILWLTLTAGGLIFASFLAWNLGANYAPVLSGALVGFFLANSVELITLGNPSGIAISLCVVAVWCFLRERFIPAGILCLAFSLAVKPQGAGLGLALFLIGRRSLPQTRTANPPRDGCPKSAGSSVGLARGAALDAGTAFQYGGVFCTWQYQLPRPSSIGSRGPSQPARGH